MKPVVITGCQRSGTAWISAAVTGSGYWCSHERFFRETERWPLRPETIESSWAAAPYLADVDAHVIHQTRHPLACVASLLARGTFNGVGRPSARWAEARLPAIRRGGDDELKRAMRYWLRWNRIIEEHADTTWQVEQVTGELLAATLTSYGRPTEPGRAGQALALIPARVNTWPGTRDMTWDDLPTSKLARMVRDAAVKYGYQT